MTNKERAARFEAVAHSYAGHDYTCGWGGLDDATVDLLTDALHFWGTEEFDKCLRIARGHYESELEKEDE